MNRIELSPVQSELKEKLIIWGESDLFICILPLRYQKLGSKLPSARL